MSIVLLFCVPFIIGVIVIALFLADIVPSKLSWIVKITSVYLPAVGLLALLYLLGRPVMHVSNKLGIDTNGHRSRAIKAVLRKWNDKKFNPLGFTWTYCEDTDSLELSIDADLEIYEEKTESARPSLKNT